MDTKINYDPTVSEELFALTAEEREDAFPMDLVQISTEKKREILSCKKIKPSTNSRVMSLSLQ